MRRLNESEGEGGPDIAHVLLSSLNSTRRRVDSRTVEEFLFHSASHVSKLSRSATASLSKAENEKIRENLFKV